MGRPVSKSAVARDPQIDCGEFAGIDVRAPQQRNLFERRVDDTSELRAICKRILTETGGVQAFAADLDTTASAISRAFAGVDGYEVNIRHIAALLDEDEAEYLVRWLCKRIGGEFVRKRPDRTDAEKLAALTKAARKSGKAGAAVLEEAAGELDIDPECF